MDRGREWYDALDNSPMLAGLVYSCSFRAVTSGFCVHLNLNITASCYVRKVTTLMAPVSESRLTP